MAIHYVVSILCTAGFSMVSEWLFLLHKEEVAEWVVRGTYSSTTYLGCPTVFWRCMGRHWVLGTMSWHPSDGVPVVGVMLWGSCDDAVWVLGSRRCL